LGTYETYTYTARDRKRKLLISTSYNIKPKVKTDRVWQFAF